MFFEQKLRHSHCNNRNWNSQVKKGETLCVIEAMKLFNEIECEMDCKIIKILVDDQTPIEFDQPLFLVDPS